MENPGDTVGQFYFEKIIGDGGMGRVFKGTDVRFNRPVAIKSLHLHLRRDEQVVERFKQEAVAQAQLGHPHIITVHDFVAEHDHLFMVMEYIEGSSVADLMEGGSGPIPIETSTDVIIQVLGAVSHAHSRGVVHRDIKPSNILVHETSGDVVAKICDFGVAKILGDEKLKTATGAKMGTLAYMSPEQLRSPKSVDERSDVYSIGATFYEMVTGETPFSADTEYGMMESIIQAPIQPPTTVNPTLPDWVDEVIEKAMAKSPGDRYQSCAELRNELQALRSGGAFVSGAAAAPEQPPVAGPPPTPVGQSMDPFPGLPEPDITSADAAASHSGPSTLPPEPSASMPHPALGHGPPKFTWSPAHNIFALLWAAFTFVAALVARFTMRGILAGGMYGQSYLEVAFLHMLLLSTAIGFAQWFLLNRYFDRAYFWILMSVAGRLAFIPFLAVYGDPYGYALSWLGGLLLATAQYFALRPIGKQALLWVPVVFGFSFVPIDLWRGWIGFAPVALLGIVAQAVLMAWLVIGHRRGVDQLLFAARPLASVAPDPSSKPSQSG